jgi:ABC-type transport system involved in multi-copper enzyme maturation permease subunit
MTRQGYLVFMLFFALVLPLFLAAMVGLLPRMRPNTINLPNREHWLDPVRREGTLNALSAYGAWLGIMIAIFTAALHYVLLVANTSSPPRLPGDLFWMLLVGFLVAIAVWIGALYMRFRNR